MATNQAPRILPKLFVATTATGGTIFACHHLESQRRILDDKSDGCTSSTISGALTTSGVAIVDNLRLTPKIINDVKSMPASNSMPTQIIKPKRQQRRGPANMMPKDETWRLSAYGRYHCLENHLGEEDIKLLEEIEKKIYPLVQSFFEQQDIEEEKEDSKDKTTTKDSSSTNNKMEGIYRSELQLMTAVPQSGNQSWHKDNRARGLSIIIPLVDFTSDNGGTQLLLGSHNNKWPLNQGGARVIQAPAGSIVAYDSRTIHRGLGNDTDDGRPALIFCYDRCESPPPRLWYTWECRNLISGTVG